MLEIFYEDNQLLVVKKPIGVESQATHSFVPDMVSEIRRHINHSSTKVKEPYVGVIHRLDKPVGGIMVYAKSRTAAEALSRQVQEHRMQKVYKAVICGKPVDNVGNFVDYLLKDGKNNQSKIVDKRICGAKRAELNYKVLKTLEEEKGIPLSLLEISLVTGRHHQIRVQFAGHGFPLWGDRKYNPMFKNAPIGLFVALSAYKLRFFHPVTDKIMEFKMRPEGEGFRRFLDED